MRSDLGLQAAERDELMGRVGFKRIDCKWANIRKELHMLKFRFQGLVFVAVGKGLTVPLVVSALACSVQGSTRRNFTGVSG